MNIVTDKNNPVCDKSAEEDFCEKKRLFVDMDGTLTEWRNIGFDTPSSEEINELSMREKLDKVLYCPGYFSSLKEHEHVVMAINKIVNENHDVEVYIMSCVLPDKNDVSPIKQKNEWLDNYLPNIDTAHRIFVPDGEPKSKYVPNGVQKGDFLLDDYTKNLIEWESTGNGVGIKLLNQVNSSKGKWNGSKVANNGLSKFIARDILLIMDGQRIEHKDPDKFKKIIYFEDFLKSAKNMRECFEGFHAEK